VNASVWPPRYLVLTSSQSLEEVEDDDLFFEREDRSVHGTTTPASVESSGDEMDGTVDPWVSSSDSSSHDSLEDNEFKEPPQTQPAAVLPESIPSGVQNTQVSKKYNDDIETLCKGEKLCKSALSAISFGDAPTAVKYLQQALEALQVENK